MAEDDEIVALPGIFLDANNSIVIALLYNSAVQVSVDRSENWPTAQSLHHSIEFGRWIVVKRHSREVLVVQASGLSKEDTPSPQQNESTQFAIELALHAWPEWQTAELLKEYTPRYFIPLPINMPLA